MFCCIIVKQCKSRLVGQAVKTSASHAENMGSIPVRVTIEKTDTITVSVFSILWCLVRGISPCDEVAGFETLLRPSPREARKTEQIPVPIRIPSRYPLFLFYGDSYEESHPATKSLGSHTLRRARRARS